MSVHDSDVDHWSEIVPSMSILHRTYRVTRLRVIYLLNTRQGVWEKFAKKVSETTEEFQRENSEIVSSNRKVVSGYTIKSNWFWDTPDNSWRVLELFWKLLGIFQDKNRKWSGAAETTSYAFRRWKSLIRNCYRADGIKLLFPTRCDAPDSTIH